MNKTNLTVTDYEGNVYPVVIIGNIAVMGKNLCCKAKKGKCCVYENDDKNLSKFGRLYDHEAATHAGEWLTENGWHLLTDDELKQIEIAMGMSKEDADDWGYRDSGEVGTKLKAGGESGLNLLLGGYQNTNGNYYGLGSDGYYWTSTEYSSSSAWYRRLSSGQAGVYRYYPGKASRYSVRCVKVLSESEREGIDYLDNLTIEEIPRNKKGQFISVKKQAESEAKLSIRDRLTIYICTFILQIINPSEEVKGFVKYINDKISEKHDSKLV